MNLDKRTVGLVAAFVVALVLIIVFASKPKVSSPPPKNPLGIDLSTTSPEVRIAKTQDIEAVLVGFPQDFPVEEGVQSQGGYKLVPANSKELQSTVEYVSHKSLAENAKIFKGYLNAAGFAIINELSQPTFVFYYAAKDQNDLSIKIQLLNGQVTVTASYLKR